MKFVTEHEVLEIELQYGGFLPDGKLVHRFAVQSSKGEAELGTWRIDVSSMAYAGNAGFSSDAETGRTLLGVVRPKLRAAEYSGQMTLSTTNVDQLLAPGRAVSEEDQELEIAKIIWRFFYEKDPPLTTDVVVFSTGFKRKDVVKVLKYMARSGIVKTDAGVTKVDLTAEGMSKLEERIQHGLRRRFPPVGYFHEVPLPPEFDAPYVFVLMPFSEDQLPQHWYRNIIKPTVEAATGVQCWRADESQNQLQITDQIFTQIVHADVIVAEISSLNPNVMIEIGVALANNKQVYIFYDMSRLTKLPFYIDKIPCEGYASDDELRQKLEKVRIASR